MKIGVILHGQLRTGLSCAKYIKKLFDNYDTDFFIHHWEVSNPKMLDTEKYSNPKYNDKFIPNEQLKAMEGVYYHTEDEFNKIKEIYKPKDFSTSKLNDDYELARENLTKEGETGVMGYYSAIKALFGLSMYQNKTKSKYDLVIRMRPDVIVPKSQIKGFHQALYEMIQNPKRLYSQYHIESLDKFPIIDYYQIASYSNMVELHKWVYEREFGIDTDLQKVIFQLIDKEKLIITDFRFKTLIIRNIMDDDRLIKILYEKWDDVLNGEDIYNHMMSYMHPVYSFKETEYYEEHVYEPITKEKIIENVIKLYSK